MTRGVRRARGESRAEAGPALTLTRRGLFALSAGLVVVLAWVFLLGVWAGRGDIFDTPFFKQIEDRLPEAEAGPSPELEVIVSGEEALSEGDGQDGVELTFYDSLDDDPAGRPSVTRKVNPPRPEKEARTGSRRLAQPAPESPADKTPADFPPEETAGSAPAPGTAVVSSKVKTVDDSSSQARPPERRTGENYTVQVAAAPTLEEAEQETARLRARGFDAYHYQVRFQGRSYFRIRVGRYATRDEAKEARNRLRAAGLKNMFVSELTD